MIFNLKGEKSQAIKSQNYEAAAQLRDKEKQLLDHLDKAKLRWEEESKLKKFPVKEEEIAAVIGMMTGISVSKISEKERC